MDHRNDQADGMGVGAQFNLQIPLGRKAWSLQHRESRMPLSQGARQAADEEARAEVEVLNSRLEKTRILNAKLAASLQRLEATGKNVEEAIGPLASNTSTLRIVGNNIDSILAAIDRIRQPSDVNSNEEEIIRRGPASGLTQYLSCVKRISKALAELQQTNLRSNQQAIAERSRLLKMGNSKLETYFKEQLQEESQPEEPLRYITKDKPFPTLSSERTNRLGPVKQYMVATSKQGAASMAQIYADVRGPYLTATLANLASACLNTAKRKNQDAIYQAGSSGLDMYTLAMQEAFLAEYESIGKLFTARDESAQAFNLTAQGAISELARTLRELNSHIRANLNTDCFLGYEIIAVMSKMSTELQEKTGELKSSFTAAVKPVRETGKASLAELLDDTRRRVANLPTIPTDGAAVPITNETMTRLQSMADYLGPISSLMISVGDSGWKSTASSQTSYSTDQVPTLNSFDVSADGRQIFAHYCVDTIITLLEALDRKAQPLAKNKSVSGVFILNNIAIIDRAVKYSELKPLLEATPRLAELDKWRKNGMKDYSLPWQELCRQLMDKTQTRGPRPQSGSVPIIDSSAIVKGLSSKEKDAIKENFRVFNAVFDELVQKHKSLSMEREVKTAVARDVQALIEVLYHRFWDKYHEIDKGKGKYVKYDKAAISTIFIGMGN